MVLRHSESPPPVLCYSSFFYFTEHCEVISPITTFAKRNRLIRYTRDLHYSILHWCEWTRPCCKDAVNSTLTILFWYTQCGVHTQQSLQALQSLGIVAPVSIPSKAPWSRCIMSMVYNVCLHLCLFTNDPFLFSLVLISGVREMLLMQQTGSCGNPQ